MKKFISPFLALVFIGCGGGGGSSESVSSSNIRVNPITSSDKTVLLNDEFSKYQWHRNKLSLDTLNQTYLGYNGGNPIIIQVTDDGIDADHEDLKNNMNFLSSYNDVDASNDPTPKNNINNNRHGTQVAGVIGAMGYNNIGLKGVAPSSNLAGFTFESVGNNININITNLERAWFSGPNANNIAVSNNSWGSCVSEGSLDINAEAILKKGSETLRSGKGRVYVFAGGNGREGNFILNSDCPDPTKKASSNATYLTNSQYSIAVAAVSENDKVTSYSSPGANILISGYSGQNFVSAIATTMPEGTAQSGETWSRDINKNYTHSFSGTSAAAPFVSGILALVLEACPNLSYRDLKYLLAKHARKVDVSNSSWVTNNAGFHHSNDYGFGVINPQGMISECTTSFTSLGERDSIQEDKNSISTAISTSTLSQMINVSKNLTIEWVGLKVKSDYSHPGNLQIKLISPLGTESELLHFDNQFGTNTLYFSTGFRLASQTFMGEKSSGDWKIEIISNNSLGSGNLNSLSLEIVGH